MEFVVVVSHQMELKVVAVYVVVVSVVDIHVVS